MAQNIRRNIEELKKACEGLDEGKASRAPEGRWSPKEVLSHLLGPEGRGHLPILQAFLDQETPRINMEIEPIVAWKVAGLPYPGDEVDLMKKWEPLGF